jgi:glycosyltransferase, family 1
MKKILIISNGPVPAPEIKNVEGGGLRAWGLANGLQSNSKDKYEVEVSYNQVFKQDNFTDELNGIKISTWEISTLAEKIQEFDSVLVSYNAGDITQTVVDNIRQDQQLILDGYVPIHIEMSARNSDNLDREYDAFNFENKIWTKALRRGDILLCANEAQKKFYTGVMAQVGRINPITYGDEDLIQIVPYGIYREKAVAKHDPVSKLVKNKKAFKLLWFGGIYPWFDLTNLLEAVKNANKTTPIELIMVGVKNPFNQHPDFIKRYEEVMDYIKNNNMDEIVHITDWVKFEDRAEWYLGSDAVVLINNIGMENTLAWRTRLVDYVWADLPIVTNGGDPMSDILEANKAVYILPDLDAKTIEKEIIKISKDKETLKQVSTNLSKVRRLFYWDKVTENLSKLISKGYKPADAGLLKEVEILNSPVLQNAGGSRIVRAKNKARRVAGKALRYYKNNGFAATYKIATDKVVRKIKRKTVSNIDKRPKIIIVSHQLDNTGAPFVAMDLAFDIQKQVKNLGRKLKFIAFTPINIENVRELKKAGIEVEIYTDRNLWLNYNKGDIVILNSFGLSRAVTHSTIQAAKNNTLDAFYWYGHEATPERFVDLDTRDEFVKLLESNKAKLYAVSKGSAEAYKEFFGTDKNTEVMNFRFDFPSDRFAVKDPEDFEKLDFVVTGAVSDGRKGQLPILYAFLNFYNNFYKKNPKIYRDFSLKFIGVDEAGYIKKQMEVSAKGLDGKCEIVGQIPRAKVLDFVEEANMTICYSYHESMGIFVYEGMAFGHPIIRNDCYGQEEQLIDGGNGWAVQNDDYQTLCDAIEESLNLEKTSNDKLAKMSKVSEEIAEKATHSEYFVIDEIKKVLNEN